MPKLTSAARKALPKKTFAGPGRSFPLTDKSHGRAALSGAPKSVKAGNISQDEADKIKAKVHSKFPSIGQRLARGKKAK